MYIIPILVYRTIVSPYWPGRHLHVVLSILRENVYHYRDFGPYLLMKNPNASGCRLQSCEWPASLSMPYLGSGSEVPFLCVHVPNWQGYPIHRGSQTVGADGQDIPCRRAFRAMNVSGAKKGTQGTHVHALVNWLKISWYANIFQIFVHIFRQFSHF